MEMKWCFLSMVGFSLLFLVNYLASITCFPVKSQNTLALGTSNQVFFQLRNKQLC